jgi:molybdopterin converting factor small subunit
MEEEQHPSTTAGNDARVAAEQGLGISRRAILKSMALAVTGVGIGLLVLGPARALRPGPGVTETAQTHTSSTTSSPPAALPSGSPVHVHVKYFQMAQTIQTKEEGFVLTSPAHVSDLIAAVISRHLSLGVMMNTMMLLVNGVGVVPSSMLMNGDEVDFIPATTGG